VNGSLPVLMNRSEIKRSHSICADRAARRDAPIQVPLNLDQEALAATMRTAWANFAANGDPSSAAVPWRSFNGGHIMSLVPPQPEIVDDFASRHHCSFWASR